MPHRRISWSNLLSGFAVGHSFLRVLHGWASTLARAVADGGLWGLFLKTVPEIGVTSNILGSRNLVL